MTINREKNSFQRNVRERIEKLERERELGIVLTEKEGKKEVKERERESTYFERKLMSSLSPFHGPSRSENRNHQNSLSLLSFFRCPDPIFCFVYH